MNAEGRFTLGNGMDIVIHAKDTRKKASQIVVCTDAVPDVPDETAHEDIYLNLDGTVPLTFDPASGILRFTARTDYDLVAATFLYEIIRNP